MASLTIFSAGAKAAFTTQQRRSTNQSRRAQRCYAQTEDEKRSLNFEANKRAALGFTDSDSAGQTNIFAVEPKLYVAGSKTDSAVGAGNSTFATASVAGSVAVGAIVAGLLLNSGPTTLDSIAPAADVASLSQYSAQFASELGLVTAAPTLSE